MNTNRTTYGLIINVNEMMKEQEEAHTNCVTVPISNI